MFRQIDFSNGKGGDFIRTINNIDDIDQAFDIAPLTQAMVTSDGWKYLLVISKNLGNSKVKVAIPFNMVYERLAQIECSNENAEHNTTETLNVLVIDDSTTTCLLTRVLFKRAGHNAEYETESSAVVNMPLNGYDIIICDIVMPNINGIALCGMIKQKLRKKTKLIAMSSDCTEELIDKCMSKGNY